MDRQPDDSREAGAIKKRRNIAHRLPIITTINASNRAMITFRAKLSLAMMLVVSAITVLGLYLAQRNVTATAEHDLQQNFQTELSSLHKLQDLRHIALAERCRTLASNPRIHAALEDNALDLLYPSARDELRDLMEGDEPPAEQAASTLHARFYRFLDANGAVLPAQNLEDVGPVTPAAEAQLALKHLPETQQDGYISDVRAAENRVDEVTAVPIFSTESGDVISALVVGFKPFEIATKTGNAGMKSGIWVNGRLHMPSLTKTMEDALASEIETVLTKGDSRQNNFRVRLDGVPHLLFYKWLNPDSLFPPAYEICVYPLAAWMGQLHRLRWQIGGAGAVLLLGGFVASHFIAVRFSKPVEKLALESEENRAERRRAEAALVSTSEKLQRSTRYSADASHQLKSPVTLLRTGLESLLVREGFTPEVYEELSALLHQTHRLTGVIDDLLLLSRMDAGQLKIESRPVNLSQLVDEWLDDLGALPDSFDVTIEENLPAELYVGGEKRYTSLIVQNLLENARRYNRPSGRIRVTAQTDNGEVSLLIGNTGPPIPPDAQEHLFERFQRPATGSVTSGHGLGLNLARDLARLHGGDLRLVHSSNDWTEFEVRLRVQAPLHGQA
jgi:signal transduction histidine kinase